MNKRIIPALLVILLLVSACGQKGPLFRPGDNQFAAADSPRITF